MDNNKKIFNYDSCEVTNFKLYYIGDIKTDYVKCEDVI